MYRYEVYSKQWPSIRQKFKAYPVQNIMLHEGVLVELHAFLASPLDEDEW
jgi:hypothetical protein